MTLRERDRNRLSDGARQDTKRKRVDIDLTADESDKGDQQSTKTPRTKHQDLSAQHRQNNAQSAYQTPPASSAPRSSQSQSSSQPRSSSLNNHREIRGPQTSTQAQRDSWLAEEEDNDLDAVVGSSTQQRVADASAEQYQYYGNLDTRIVGVRFYRGNANMGEQVLLRREPGNPYDTNAIRVDNVAGEQIGHMPRQIAKKLAPYMDSAQLLCEGELAGIIAEFDCPLLLRLFGPEHNSELGRQVMAKMKEDKLPLKEIGERIKRDKKQQAEELKNAAKGAKRFEANGNSKYANQRPDGDGSTAPVMDDILEASQRFNPREGSNSADSLGMQEDALQQLPLAEQPKSIKTEMLPYQLQALQWLLDHESPKVPERGAGGAVQLWKRDERKQDLFTNLASNYSTKQPPALASGGLLCDDMGLGKTLEMISLMVADKDQAGRKTGTTLIVSPLSVMSNWRDQIAMHVHEKKALSVYIYHGAGRINSMKAKDFSQYDVVITTYQTLASDYMPQAKKDQRDMPAKGLRSNGLYSMDWRRIILDEGHTIRNPLSKGAAAVTAVTARSRWALTGTPIVNSLKDLYCLLRFIGITGGLGDLEMFNRVLIRPLKAGETQATYLLHALMTAFTLRRRKDMKFIDLSLPPLEEYVHRIKFTAKERERYEALHKEAKGLLQTFPVNDGSKTLQAYAHLLEVLLRMRQCCNHWQLCGERVTKLMDQLAHSKTVDLSPENVKALQDLLQLSIQSHEECAICLEPLHDPVITTCAHSFGRTCISRVIETQHKCPLCRAQLTSDEECLLSPADENGDDLPDAAMDLKESSTKLDALMRILKATQREHPGEKTVVFSQWTRFLDLVEPRLEEEGIAFSRIDGTKNAAQRDAALHSLSSDPKSTVLLASLGVCAVGLNLTAANRVILADTWWAPAIEDQAVDRVHRLGQKKATSVFRLVVDQTIEEQTLEVQSEKRKLMRLAFAEKEGKRGKSGGRLAEIQRLLGS